MERIKCFNIIIRSCNMMPTTKVNPLHIFNIFPEFFIDHLNSTLQAYQNFARTSYGNVIHQCLQAGQASKLSNVTPNLECEKQGLYISTSISEYSGLIRSPHSIFFGLIFNFVFKFIPLLKRIKDNMI